MRTQTLVERERCLCVHIRGHHIRQRSKSAESSHLPWRHHRMSG